MQTNNLRTTMLERARKQEHEIQLFFLRSDRSQQGHPRGAGRRVYREKLWFMQDEINLRLLCRATACAPHVWGLSFGFGLRVSSWHVV